MKEAIEHWKKTELLHSYDSSEYISLDEVAILMEHQRLYNETLSDVDTDIDSHKFLQTFRRMSLPIILQVLKQTKTPQLVSFIPVENAATPVARHPMKTVLHDLEHEKKLHENFDLEVAEVIYVGHSLAMEIDQHVISDLRSSAGTVAYVDPSHPGTDFGLFLGNILEVVHSKCGHSPNWIVASSDVCELVKQAFEFTNATDAEMMPLGVRFLGHTQNQRLYENTLAPEGELLTGYYGKNESTYEFRPKVLLEALPERHKNTKVRRARLRTQFDIQWHDGDYYARINVKSPD